MWTTLPSSPHTHEAQQQFFNCPLTCSKLNLNKLNLVAFPKMVFYVDLCNCTHIEKAQKANNTDQQRLSDKTHKKT